MADPKIVQFSTPEMIELRQLQKERVEALERSKGMWERAASDWQRMTERNLNGIMKVAEWCFLNFKHFEPSARELNIHAVLTHFDVSSGGPPSLPRLRHFIASDGYANAATCRWLASLHRRIAKHCPSPFTREQLIEWELIQMPEPKLGLIVTPREPPPQPPKPFKRRM
jgi:hypothetical protein